MPRMSISRTLLFLLLSYQTHSVYSEELQTNLTVPDIVKNDLNWDWVRLKSGEWLKGELLSLERDALEFDSDILDDVTIDWDDVQAVYTYRPMAVLLAGGVKVYGQLQLEPNNIVIGGQTYPITFDEILRIALNAPRKLDLWRGSVSAGMTLRTGNVEEKDIDTSARFTRRTAQSTFKISYSGNFTENDNIESANNQRAISSFDYRLSQRWYLQPFRAEYYRDKFQNIDTQWHLGLGASFYVIETNTLLWTLSGGPGYQETIYFEVPEESDRKAKSSAFLLKTEYDHELTSSIDLYGSYDVTFADEDSGGITQNLTLSIELDLIGDLDLRVAAYMTHIESPQADAEGIVPENVDTRMTVGISYDL